MLGKFLRVSLAFIALITFPSIRLIAQVTADFSANITSGCGPLVVSFQNLSVNATSYQWNFGNGNNSTSQNPSAVYVTPGSYNVTLTAIGPGGNDVEVKAAYIVVFTPPNPAFASSQQVGCFPFIVNFTDQTAPGSSAITSWSWDFGDGGTSTNQSPNHQFTIPGVFDITLITSDANGCSTTELFNNIITSNNNTLNAGFTPSTFATCNPPSTVNFTNTTTGGNGPFVYSWDFDDGGSSASNSPAHNYTAVGSYDVNLTVTDVNGCVDVAVVTEPIVVAQTANVNFNAVDNTVCLYDTVEFNDNSVPEPTSWFWDFGDGTTSTLQNPTHVYASAGSYTVVLNGFYDASCQGTRTRVSYIAVQPLPTADFNSSNPIACQPPLTVSFINLSSGQAPLSYAWTFGTGGQSAAVNPNRIFNNSGSFDVGLTVTNGFGCSATLLEPDYVVISNTQADFTTDVQGFCVPLTVNFSDASTSSTAIIGAVWDFGDGTTSNNLNPQHTYNTPGLYSVTLTIQNADGCSATITQNNLISVSTIPTAAFTVDATELCAGELFQFTDQSTNANSWFWDFGDFGGTSTEQNPTHEFNGSIPYDISLTVSNNGCSATIVQQDLISVLPPYVEVDMDFDCANPLSVQFTSQVLQGNIISWDFGDGATSTQANPSHTYQTGGQYIVSLTADNSQNGCVNTLTDTIITGTSNTIFSQNFTPGCTPIDVSFTDLTNDAVSWQWDFGDGGSSLQQNPTHTYDNAGSYDVTLTTTSASGCISTITTPGAVDLNGVIGDIQIQSQTGCDQLTVDFHGALIPTGPVSSFFWDFGDGSTSTQHNPTHVYTTIGTYDVTFSVTDLNGCVTTVTDTGGAQFNSYPVADLTISTDDACVGQSIDFIDESTGEIATYAWNFGDGNTSNVASPAHAYGSTGLFDVELTVTSSLGCTDVMTIPAAINIAQPTSQFTAFPVFAFCPPLLVNFVDQSTGSSTWVWDFGDGTTSGLQNPSHIYTVSGTYTVRLIVANSAGCSDTLIVANQIQVGGPLGDFTFTPTTSGCLPHDVNFTSTTQNTITITWDFGDGFIGTGAAINHTYTDPGEFVPVLLLADNNGCSFTYQSPDTISVFQLIIDAGPDVIICQDESIGLTASGADTYSWFPALDLDDPLSATPVSTPDNTTNYIVTGMVGQCLAQDSVQVLVNPTPSVSFTVGPECNGRESVFANLTTIDAPGVVSTYDWNFGVGTSTDQNPIFLFNGAGTYDVTLTATSDSGCTASVTAQALVNSNPVAAFTISDACYLQVSDFVDQSTVVNGTIQSWQWQLGDGSTSIVQVPGLTYTDTGTYSVTLVVTASGGCTDTLTQDLTIYPLPVADFVATEVCFGDTTIFTDQTTITAGTIASWDWIFGDGNTDVVQNPGYTYQLPGTYVAAVTVTSDQGCVDEFSAVVEVRPLPATEFSQSAQSSCYVPANVSFQNISTGGVNFDWDFGNGQTAQSFNASTTYVVADTFNVVLTATNQFGCSLSTTHEFILYPTPIAIFNSDVNSGCEPLEVFFTNGSANFNDQQWLYGDSEFSNELAPDHTYNEDGQFAVTLIVSGIGGCADTLVVPNYITVFGSPTPGFNYQSIGGEGNDGEILFTNVSSPVVSILWDFGDGESSTAFNPTHGFESFGSKRITQIITDANGCVDTLIQYITVEFFGALHVPTALVYGMSGEAGLFLPKGTGLTSYRLQIFDEWGNKLFETNALNEGQPAEGWDGSLNGDKLPQGSYVWKIDAVFASGDPWTGTSDGQGNTSRSGTVTVLY